MYWMHGNEEHNPKAIDYRRSEKSGPDHLSCVEEKNQKVTP